MSKKSSLRFVTLSFLVLTLLTISSCKTSSSIIPEEYLDNPTYCEAAVDCTLQDQCCGCPTAVNTYYQKEVSCDADDTQGKNCPLNCRDMSIWCVKNECTLSVPRKATLLGTDNNINIAPEETIILQFGIENTKKIPLTYIIEVNESVEELFGEIPLDLVTSFGTLSYESTPQTLVPGGRVQLQLNYTAPKVEGTFSYTFFVIDEDPALQAVNESIYSQVNFYIHVNESYER